MGGVDRVKFMERKVIIVRRLIDVRRAALPVFGPPKTKSGVREVPVAGVPCRSRLTMTNAFPPGFLWGASCAPHQNEGNNTGSDMWALEQFPGSSFVERSGDSVDFYHRW